jgi:hypothetical protein
MTNTIDAIIFKVEAFESPSDFLNGYPVIINKIFVPSMEIIFWIFNSKLMCFKSTYQEIKNDIVESTDIKIQKDVIENIINIMDLDIRRKNIEIGVVDVIKNYSHNGEYKKHTFSFDGYDDVDN